MTERVAIFDLGMVLSTPTGLFDRLATVLGTTPDVVERGFWGPHRHAYDEGTSDLEFWRTAIAQMDGVEVPDLEALLGTLVTTDTGGWQTIRDDAWSILSDLGERGTRVFVLSNAPRSFADTAPGFDWNHLVEHFFFSAHLGVAKPAAGIYSHVEQALGLDGDSLWFVDDKIVNVDAASARGWHAHLWVDDADTRAWLRTEGFLD